MARACESALGDVPALRDRIDRLTVVDIMTKVGPAPATRARHPARTRARRGPGGDHRRGQHPPVAGQPGRLGDRRRHPVVHPDRRGRGHPVVAGPPGPGPGARRGRGRSGSRTRWSATTSPGSVRPSWPSRCWPRSTSTRCSRTCWPPGPAGTPRPSAPRWVRSWRRSPGWPPPTPTPGSPRSAPPAEIATPTPDNRIVCEPYTKRMTAFLGSDQGAAVIVCSLAAARRAGVADRAVFVWSGAEAVDVRFVASRHRSGTLSGHRRGRRGAVRPRPPSPPGAASVSTTSTGWTSTRASPPPCRWPPRRWAWPPTTPGG